MSNRDLAVNVAENVVRGLIKSGVTPQELFVGIHNAFCHGEIFEECDIECSDGQLGELFEHIDALSKIAKKLR